MSEHQGKGRVNLKAYFGADKMPREGHFADLIDASLNKIDDQLFIRVEGEGANSARFLGIGSTDPQSPLSIRNRTGNAKCIGLEDTGGDEEWHISINPPDGHNGFMIASNDKPDAALLLDAEGKVGIGTKTPEERLHVNGSLKLEQGVAVQEISNNNTLNENSSGIIPTQQAVKEYIDNLFIASVSAFAMETPPEGWLECNGQAISREIYNKLFDKIGITFGDGNGETTFNVPDLRGEFIRGWDHGRNIDTGRQFSSGQEDSIQNHQHDDLGHSHNFSHSHGASMSNAGNHSHSFSAAKASTGDSDTATAVDPGVGQINVLHETLGTTAPNGSHSHNITINSTNITINGIANVSDAINANVEDETRPTNVALLYCIKY